MKVFNPEGGHAPEARLCLKHLQLLPTLLCDVRDASWQSKNGLHG